MNPIRSGVLLAAAVTAPAFAQPAPFVVFLHDEVWEETYRLEDLDGDGEVRDPGEATLFVDGTAFGPVPIGTLSAIVPIDAHSFYALDRDLGRVILARDHNLDGDALDPGETTGWFSGAYDLGLLMQLPTDAALRSDGSLLVVDTNINNPLFAEFLVALRDNNADGDADDPGEVQFQTILELAGVPGEATNIFDIDLIDDLTLFIRDSLGNDFASISTVEINPNSVDLFTRTVYAEPTDFNNFDFTNDFAEIAQRPAENELLLTAITGPPGVFDTALLGIRDLDDSGDINIPTETRLLWTEPGDAFDFGPLELKVAPDDTVFMSFRRGVQDGGLVRLVDLDGDADWRDPSETMTYYGPTGANLNGLKFPFNAGAFGIWAPPANCNPADLAPPQGILDLADIDAFIAAFLAGEPAADIAPPQGVLDLSDVDAFIAAFLAGCP